MEKLELKNISVSYKKKQVVKDFSYCFSKGKLYGIKGKNGIGKTTLLYAINGIIPHDIETEFFGEISIDEKNINSLKINERANFISTIFQDHLFRAFASDVREELAFYLENLTLSQIEISQRIEKILEYFDLKKYADKDIKSLSQGIRQLVHIASVVIADREIILADEPLSNVYNKKKYMEMFKKLSQDKIVILVLHESEDSLFDDIICLESVEN